ncbi:MAG: amino acid adenylation domain-containing protein [Luteolibacter sp.]
MPETIDRGLHLRLEDLASSSPDQTAFRFLIDGETSETSLDYATLALRARRLANLLISKNAATRPVILAYPPGPDFLIGLFACWHAGAIAVPAYPPQGSRHRKRLAAILADSSATFMLAAPGTALPDGISRIDAEQAARFTDRLPEIESPETCLIQYTSGSTSTPKGVRISHANIRGHFASFKACTDGRFPRSIVSWLPPYHDMGLMLKILFSIEIGVPLVWFSPEHFIQRPARWLQAISRYHGEFSGAPNFAFDLCTRGIRDEEIENIDLSHWRYVPCGAERVRAETLEKFAARFSKYGFREQSFKPGYGLAEATLVVTALSAKEPLAYSNHPQHGTLVSNGRPLPGIDIRIIDPATGKTLPHGQTGEIQLSGKSISAGYWNHPDFKNATFRTGDLGYFENGHLYLSGRLKDLIILNGENHYPDDIEQTLLENHPSITAAAAFASENTSSETIDLALEVPANITHFTELANNLRLTLTRTLELQLGTIHFTRQGLLPRTTSGKIQRHAVKKAISEKSLRLTHQDSPAVQISEDLLPILQTAISEITGKHPVSPADDIVSLGMSSIDVTRLIALVQSRAQRTFTHAEIFAARSLQELAGNAAPASSPPAEIISGSGTGAHCLTHSQERMWFLHGLAPESAAYHVFGALEFSGNLDPTALDRAYQETVGHHSILKSRHANQDGKPHVWIEAESTSPLVRHHAENDARLSEIFADFSRRPFSLDTEPPIRSCLITLDSRRHILALCAHHIAADGWSIRILTRELANRYQNIAFTTDAPAYLDYAVWHRQWVESGAVDSQIGYWKNRLAGHSGIMPLATDFPRPNVPSSDGGAVEHTLSADLSERIQRLAATHRATPFMVQLAAFHLLLYRHGAGADQVIAVPVANRNHACTGELIGTLVNTLPFRTTLELTESFETLLTRIREAAFEMQAAQDAPFEKIIEAVKPERSRDHSPLAQVMFDHQEIPLPEQWGNDLTCKPLLAHRGAVQFDLSLLMFSLPGRQQAAIEYRGDLFRHETAARLLRRYLGILETITRDPSLTLQEISALTSEDREQLHQLSHGPTRPDFPWQTTPELIAKRCALNPQRPAIFSGDASLTYAALHEKSSRFASGLRNHGIKPGERIAILLERNELLPAAIFAIWKTGATYVPLDAANPKERLALILEDQSPVRVLVSPSLTGKLPDGVSTISFDASLEADPGTDHETSPEENAYIIYTSGSTGKPKGVVISHGELANFLLSMAETPGFTEADKLLAVTTVSFDISTLELFLPLVIGGSVDIVPGTIARDGVKLLDRLSTSRATVLQATPATWHLLMDAGWRGSPDLKALCGGEALDLSFARKLRPLCHQLWNMYGPTETTVWSSLWQVPKNPEIIRIGSPIANTGCHVVAEDGTPTPIGVTGELWISGDGVAVGYWKHEDLTNERFVSFDQSRAYRTGDLARWNADGSLECLGRNDSQVKIRGFRVELGEIETALAAHPEVSQAKVALRADRLLAWIVPAAGKSPDFLNLREHLGSRLPVYMLPSAIGCVENFPLNASGKVDVSKLTDPERTADCRIEPPATETEIRLAAIWRELLGTPFASRDDDWFHSGGHSLLALRLFAGIHRDFGKSLPLSSILDHPTLRELAALIDLTE